MLYQQSNGLGLGVAGEPLCADGGICLAQVDQVLQGEGDIDHVLCVLHLADDTQNGLHVLYGIGALELQNALLAVALADLDVFLQGGHHQVIAVKAAVDVLVAQGLEGVEGGSLGEQLVDAVALGVVVMTENEIAVDGLAHVGLHAEIASVAGGHESGAGVFTLQAGQTSVSNDHGILVVSDLDGVHHNVFLLVCFYFLGLWDSA